MLARSIGVIDHALACDVMLNETNWAAGLGVDGRR